MMALELVALTSFAFTCPVLSMFGAAPEWFISRDASRADIVGFALVVAIVPAAVLTLVGLASRLLGDLARHVTHIVLVTACAGLGVWRAVHDPTGGRTWALPALAVGAAGAGLVGALRARAGTRHLTARYLRFASIGGLVFLVQFLWLSPVGRTLLTPAAAWAVTTGSRRDRRRADPTPRSTGRRCSSASWRPTRCRPPARTPPGDRPGTGPGWARTSATWCRALLPAGR